MITKQALEIKMAVNDEFLVPILQELLKMFGVDKIADAFTPTEGPRDPRVGRGSPVPTAPPKPKVTTFVPPPINAPTQKVGQVFSQTLEQAQAPQGGRVVAKTEVKSNPSMYVNVKLYVRKGGITKQEPWTGIKLKSDVINMINQTQAWANRDRGTPFFKFWTINLSFLKNVLARFPK